MKLSPRLLMPGVALAGFLAGFGWHRSGDAGVEDKAVQEITVPARPGRASLLAAIPLPARSTDRVEDLAELDGLELYGRLALWVGDADEAELMEFWAGYRQREKRDTWAIDLVFDRWARLNPRGAIQAAEGSGHDGIAWWAWGLNDPEAALAATLAEKSGYSGFVLRAIGQFHPDRVAEVIAEHPELLEWNAVEGIAEGMQRTDPRAAVEFAVAHDGPYNKTLESWLRDDPWEAWLWAKEHSKIGGGESYSDFAIQMLEREDPEMLKEIARRLPEGKQRREVEAAMFRDLLAKDPEAALAAAREAKSPRLVAERLAMLGTRLAAEDPERSFALMEELLGTLPDPFNRRMESVFPDGSSWNIAESGRAKEHLGALVAIDPWRAYEMVAGQEERANEVLVVQQVWLERDETGFAEWLVAQEPGDERDRGAGMMASKLMDRGDPAAAAKWAMSVSSERARLNTMVHLADNWWGSDPVGMRRWFEQADLSDEIREVVKPYMEAK